METIYAADDVDERVLEAAESAEEWFADNRIDWDEFWDRLDAEGFFVGDVTSPAARKIQRHVQQWRRS